MKSIKSVKSTEKTKRRDTGIRILRRPGEIRRDLESLRERRMECLAVCGHAAARYGNTRVMNGARERGENILLTLADLDAKIKNRRAKLAAAERDADLLLGDMAAAPDRTSRRDAEILRLRYQMDLSWREVREHLRREGYAITERGLRNWHKIAVRRANAVWENRP